METIIQKLKKIQELAEKGIEGEAKAAKIMLDKFLLQHNLTLDDIKQEKKEKRLFKYVTVHERSVMINCISKVLDDPKMTYSWYKNKKKEFFVEMTDWQYIEAQDLIKFHIKQFRKELKKKLEALTRAYIHNHNLFSETQSDGEGKKLSPEEISEILRAMEGLEDVSYLKKIEA
jgi:hypothetical protein